MRLIASGVLIGALTFALATQAGASRFHGGCNTHRCLERVCRSAACKGRVANRLATARKRRATRPYRAWLYSTRMCESGGNYGIATGNGYFGAYQFDLASWRGAGGSGMPHLNPPLEQDYRAVRWRQMVGTGAWPVCG